MWNLFTNLLYSSKISYVYFCHKIIVSALQRNHLQVVMSSRRIHYSLTGYLVWISHLTAKFLKVKYYSSLKDEMAYSLNSQVYLSLIQIYLVLIQLVPLFARASLILAATIQWELSQRLLHYTVHYGVFTLAAVYVFIAAHQTIMYFVYFPSILTNKESIV